VACRRVLAYRPGAPPFTDQADAAASPAPTIDALVQLEALGVELRSDGRSVWLAGDDWRRVPPDLMATIRQRGHLLARMIGDNTRPDGRDR
jgi:hypothetical protein